MGNGIPCGLQYQTEEEALADGKTQAEIDAFIKGPDDDYIWNCTMESEGATNNQFYTYAGLTNKEKSKELKKPYPSYGQGEHTHWYCCHIFFS